MGTRPLKVRDLGSIRINNNKQHKEKDEK